MFELRDAVIEVIRVEASLRGQPRTPGNLLHAGVTGGRCFDDWAMDKLSAALAADDATVGALVAEHLADRAS